ncbi:MAG: T9SS type A sorting domain-containing protein [Rhodothermales bacterium]
MTMPKEILTSGIITVALVALFSFAAPAQVSHGGNPYSFLFKVSQKVDAITMAPVNNTQEIARDRDEREQALRTGRRYLPRSAKAIDVDFGLSNSGVWSDLVDGGRLWRLRIKSPGATAVNFIFDQFYLPDGATLFIYNQEHGQVIGAFTSENNKPYRRFSTMPVKGDDVTLEYFEPALQRGRGVIHLANVVHRYRDWSTARLETAGKTLGEDDYGYGQSAACEVDINCSAGSSWQTEKKAVAMTLVDATTRDCTGVLLNSSGQDWTPYFLTAFHCADDNEDDELSGSEISAAEDWLFWFGYENTTCNGTWGTLGMVSGATLRASNDTLDFLLLELSAHPDAGMVPEYAGWSRSSSAPTSVAGIHHPKNDVKKISKDDDTVTLDNWEGLGTTENHWFIDDWDTGDTEHGSSGSPLFDQNHRVIGSLTGGQQEYCHANGYDDYAYYAAFYRQWDPAGSGNSAELRHWLDPSNSNTTLNTIQGYPNPPSNLTITNPNDDGEFLHLSWTASSTSGVTYKVERCGTTSELGACYPWFSVIGTTSSTSYTDTDVMIEVPPAPGEPYQRYRVYAFKNNVASAYSNEVQMIATSLYKYLSDETPETVELSANYPNPFNPTTEIAFSIPEKTHVSLSVFNQRGQEIAKLLDRQLPAGKHSVVFNASEYPSGTYIYRLKAGSFQQTRQMVLVK